MGGGAGKGLTYAGSSRGWPRASRWRGWLPCSCLWAGGNLRTRGSGSPFGHRCLSRRALPIRTPGSAAWALGRGGGRVCLPSRGGAPELRDRPLRAGGSNQPEQAARDNKGALCAGPPAWGSGKRPCLQPARSQLHAPGPARRPLPTLALRSSRTPGAPPRRPSLPFGPLDPTHAPPGPSPRRRPLAGLGARSRTAGTGALGH